MNYRPDEATLISYGYGELDAKEAEKVAQYLSQNPDARRQLDQLMSAAELMRHLEDKEVIAPPVFMNDHSHDVRFWQTTSFKTVVSIAASFLLLIVAGKLSGLEVNYAAGELRIAFGAKTEKNEQPVQQAALLSPAQVQDMIDASLNKNNEFMAARWEDNQKKLNQSINMSLASNSKKIDLLVRDASAASQDQVRNFVASLQTENLRLMQDYLRLSAKEQKQYVENLLVDFSAYLKEQRNQDLQLLQTRLSSVEKNTDQFKQETEQILASIISKGTIRQKNNY